MTFDNHVKPKVILVLHKQLLQRISGWLRESEQRVKVDTTAVCRTIVIQQAVIGGGLGVLCG